MSEYRMPSLGADMKDAVLVEWYVKPGDKLKKGDIIADLETDKGDIDAEVYEDGIVEKLIAKPGDKLPVGTVLALIKSNGEDIKEEEVKLIPKKKSKKIDRIKISPLARSMANKLGLDISQIKGTGHDGAIQREDIENALAQSEFEQPAILEKKEKHSGSEQTQRMRGAIAAAMSLSNKEIPHYYLVSEINMSKALEWLQKENQQRPIKKRLIPAALLIKAVAMALAKVPQLNAYWSSDQVQLQEAINVGLTISLRTGGLMIPAVINADDMSIDDIMETILDLTQRARSGKLKISELSSSTITVTNLGDRGVKSVYGVIYPPQVALIGLGKIMEQPWAENGLIGVRSVLHATLAADHRATDGHIGGRFLEEFNQLLQQPDQL